MELLVIFTILFVLFILFDLVPIFKSKNYKEFWIYSSFLAIAYTSLILYIFGVKIPNVNNLIFDIFKNFPLR